MDETSPNDNAGRARAPVGSDEDRFAAMEKRIAALETRIAVLEPCPKAKVRHTAHYWREDGKDLVCAQCGVRETWTHSFTKPRARS